MMFAALIRFRHGILLLEGGKRLLLAVLAGAFGALALPPYGVIPAMMVSMTLAIWLLDSCLASGRWRVLSVISSAFTVGWMFGFGYFLAGLWWLGAAFLVEAETFAWAMPFGVLGLPLVLGLFFGFAFAGARMFWGQGISRLLVFVVAVSLAEYARAVLFTGFPWNNVGMVLGQYLWLMQSASFLGLHGLTVITLLLCVPFALMACEHTRWKVAGALMALFAMGLLAILGFLRLPSGPSETVPNVRLRILQPNLPQDDKFIPANREDILRRYLTLSDRATTPATSGISDVTHLIWPESAFPFLLHRDARALAQIAAFLPPGVTLVTGAARAGESLPGETGLRYFNAIHAIAHDGIITATYDKRYLVPFGEYLPRPFETLLRLSGLRPFVAIPGGFEKSQGQNSFSVPGLPVAFASICYEAIFPEAMMSTLSGSRRPRWILNVTNDGWFGNTPGPRQHFAQSRLRAVEQGLPLVRAANTGISAIIDPYGRIIRALDVGTEGVIDGPLPNTTHATLYARYANIPFYCLVICIMTAAFAFRRGKRV
jgi:apolipoprotein N-acyltransferase